MPKIKYSKDEPAPRVITLELSLAETLALGEWHVAQAKSITRLYGRESMKLAMQLMPKRRVQQALLKTCKARCDAHGNRSIAIIKLAQSQLSQKKA